MGVSKNSGTPKWMVYNGKLYENGWSGGTTIYGNLNWDQMWCWIYTLPKIQIKIASIWVFPYMGIPALSIRHGKDRFYRHYSLFYGFFGNLFPSHKKTTQHRNSSPFGGLLVVGIRPFYLMLQKKSKKLDTWNNEENLLMVSCFPSLQKPQAKGAIVRHECIVNGALGTFQPELRSGKAHPTLRWIFALIKCDGHSPPISGVVWWCLMRNRFLTTAFCSGF